MSICLEITPGCKTLSCSSRLCVFMVECLDSQLLTEDKKRLESKLSAMEEEFEDLQTDVEQANTQLRRANMQVFLLLHEDR